MRTQSLYLALTIVLVCNYAPAQSVETSGIRDLQSRILPDIGATVSQETPREFLELPPQHRMHAHFMRGLYSLRAKGMHLPLPDESLIKKSIQRSLSPLGRMSSPHSQIYVIDTAIVRRLGHGSDDPGDTTRRLWSFNADAQRTSDLTQKLTGEIWVDTLRQSNTYDANDNMLSDLREYWSNGQWVNFHRNTYTYDANGKRLSDLLQQWDKGQWRNVERYTYTYDANGNMLSALLEDGWNGQWVKYQRWTNTYDANGNNLSWSYELWLDGQEYGSRATCTYDANGNRLSDLVEHWDNGQWVWVNFSRETYTYDANGKRLSDLVEQWDNGQWVNVERYTFTYDANGNVPSGLREDWTNTQWVNIERYTLTYDTNGDVLSYLVELWSNGQWVNERGETYTYDASGNMLSYLYEESSNGQLVNVRHETYTYDANGNMLSYLYEEWSNGQLVNVWRRRYTYDGQGNFTSVWFHRWLESSWTLWDYDDMGGGFGVTDNAGNYYFLGRGYNFTFTRRLVVTRVASESGNIVASYSLSQNYPNPFNPSTTIKYELPRSSHVSLSVYDVLGREVSVLVNEKRDAGVYEVKFDGSNLSSGVYLYRLQAGSYVDVKKFVLLK